MEIIGKRWRSNLLNFRLFSLLKKSQVCQLQGGRVKMYAYTSKEATVEDGMAEASLKIPILEFSDTWIKTYCHQ
ncbi:hypothetical protein J2X69_000938 [Algoriphagus sp. 4150]|uniref:hypothetical protein n=1 Tax=Algoriphagus sp. 4150 TaxID=2817756 RepID=UPI002860704E|nr:hypothetical protein [Algoriphagus sp. 4150]MDR7128606.1 hypothetical protein [Algoriphagus sp. 4150]